ncbi:hypothetical protein [Chitinibacter sp. GC72]|uniref:hypothetical protein n=1 Tax=Chitinibacter sp. GC72 TaxID=1526917 RepID=UPI0012FB63F5|nr:hypothetical protein [Chitinibacter sp. GC72]
MIEVLIQRTLPALGGSSTPQFDDVRTARDWLKLLPMINVPIAHAEISQALSELNQSDLAALESLKIVEQFRESVHVLQDATLSKLIGKALPLSDEEEKIWQSIANLWRLLETAYARAWHAACKNQLGIAEFLPLLAERTLYYANKNLQHLAHIYRKPGDKEWRQLFAYYELAKTQHIEKLKARDSLIPISGTSTPESIFLHALLFNMANPAQYSFKQQVWLNNRLEILATRTSLQAQAPTLPQRAPLCIDLATPAPATRRANPRTQDSELEIDTLALAQVISKRIKLLKLGEMPEKIGLGNELGPQAAEEILRDLYRLWCDHPMERTLVRRSSEQYLEAGVGLNNLHLWLARHQFAPPPQNEHQMSSTELMQIRMFGQTRARPVIAPAAPETQQWQIVNETAQGMCLNSSGALAQRLQLHQLILLADGKAQFLGQIRWLSQYAAHWEIGIELLPGIPEAACIRAQDAARFGQGDFTQVLMLGAMPALKSPATLLLPPGWFRQGRLLDYWDGKQMNRIRLVTLLGRGADYERVHFVASGGL